MHPLSLLNQACTACPPFFPRAQTLSKAGYLYDASIPESWYPNSPTSPSESQLLWPYTMDYGIPQARHCRCRPP